MIMIGIDMIVVVTETEIVGIVEIQEVIEGQEEVIEAGVDREGDTDISTNQFTSIHSPVSLIKYYTTSMVSDKRTIVGPWCRE
jgi:hypothetical protein